MSHLIRRNPDSMFGRSTPLYRILCSAPFVWTIGLLHAGFDHDEFVLTCTIGLFMPVRWNGVMSFQFVVDLFPTDGWIVMNKHTVFVDNAHTKVS